MKPNKTIPEDARNFDALPDSALTDTRTVAYLLGVDPNTVFKWRKEGKLPPSVKLGHRCTRWRVGDLRKWLAEKAGGAA